MLKISFLKNERVILKRTSIIFSSGLKKEEQIIECEKTTCENEDDGGFTKEERKNGYGKVNLTKNSNDLRVMSNATQLESTFSNRYFLQHNIVSKLIN